MKRMVFAVRDRAADTFGAPFCEVARGRAIRAFSDEINRVHTENQLYQHPEDFDLYELGEFDDSTGVFITGTPKQLAVGKDLKAAFGKPEKNNVS